jgi:hypothetical protein
LYRTNKYKHSDINIRLNIKFGSIIDDLENRLFICVYLNALETQLNTELYKMNNASYYINLSYDYKNTAEYEISIYGNRGKIFEVFNYIIQNIGIKVEKKYIDLQIEKIKKYCINYKYIEQYKLISSLLLEKVSNNYMSKEYINGHIDTIDYMAKQDSLDKILFEDNIFEIILHLHHFLVLKYHYKFH